MATVEEILDISSEMKRLAKRKYDLDKEKYEKMKNIEIEYGKVINDICETFGSIKREFYKYSFDIVKKSELDSKVIGNYIANLISEIEGEKYYYYVAQYYGRFHKEEDYGEPLSTEQASFHLIGKNPTNSYEEDCLFENRYSFLKNNDDIINLKKGVSNQIFQTPFRFYNHNQDEILEKTVDVGKYDYVYDFINRIINYKIDNNTDIISNDEIDNIYNSFLDEYKNINIKKLKQKKGDKDGKKN